MIQDDDDRSRFSALYRTNYPLILSTCIRRLGSREAAEDATHEVFRIAWQRFSEKRTLDLPWLYATARNLIGNEYRRRARSGAALGRLEPPDIPSPSTDGLEVRTAMATLRESDRELLYMCYWEELTANEIGSVLGISDAAVWVRLTRAREALRRLIASPEPERQGRNRG